jgi:hypothetical protein
MNALHALFLPAPVQHVACRGYLHLIAFVKQVSMMMELTLHA